MLHSITLYHENTTKGLTEPNYYSARRTKLLKTPFYSSTTVLHLRALKHKSTKLHRHFTSLLFCVLLRGNVKDRDHLEDLVVDGRILNWILKIGWKGVDRIHLAQNRERKQVLVHTVIKICVP